MPNAGSDPRLQVRPGRLSWIGFGMSVVILAAVATMQVLGWKDLWLLWGVALMNAGNSTASVFRLPPRASLAVEMLGALAALVGMIATLVGNNR
jgi:hypothetical protein